MAGMKPTKPERLYPVEDPATGAKTGYRTRARRLLAEGRQRGADAQSTDFEAEAEEAVDENTGYLTDDTSDLGGSRDAYKANFVAARREQPTASMSEIHQEAKKRTAGESREGSGAGPMRSASASESAASPPADYPDARWSEKHEGWFVRRKRADGTMGWAEVGLEEEEATR